MTMNHINFFNSCLNHYKHARCKHPYFADKFTDSDNDLYCELCAEEKAAIKSRAEIGEVSARLVLMAEIDEVFEAITRGDGEQAREEIADVVAVLMRMIDVIDGSAKFGDPAKKICRKCSNHDCHCNDSRGVCLRIGGVCVCANCADWFSCHSENASNCTLER